VGQKHKVACQFSTIHAAWPWMRQTEDGCGGMGNARFFMETPPLGVLPREDAQADWLVVFDEAPPGFCTTAPLERRILFVTEPPEIKKYPRSFLNQFGTVVAPFSFRGVAPCRMAVGNPCLNWHYGVRRAGQGYASPFRCLDDLRHMPLPNKTRGISVLCSDKTATEAQRRRLELVGLLRERLGDTLEVFGRGFNPVDDKMTAIAPYKYHLVLENNYLDNFWTEKLTDAWLGWSLPLYLGAPNLGAASPAPGFIALPPGEPEACARIIAQTVSDGLWEKRREAIAACRHWAIETTNVFFRAASIMQEAPPRAHRLPALEQPEPIYGVGREAVSSLYRRNRA